MTGAELAEQLRAFAGTLELHAGSVSGLTFKLDGGILLTVPSAGARRQRKWRSKGVSAPVSQASPRASPERLATRLEPVSSGVSQASRSPLTSSPPAPPSDSYPPDTAKEVIVVPKGQVTSRARLAETTTATETVPRTFEEAVSEPLCSRALHVKRDPMLGNLLRVSEWPEVIEVAAAWHTAGKRPGSPRVTQGVSDALVALFADGYLKGDVLRVARYLPTTERFRDKVLPSCLTPEVMAIALGELERVEGDRSAVRERLRRAGVGSQPEPVGELVARVAGGKAAE